MSRYLPATYRSACACCWRCWWCASRHSSRNWCSAACCCPASPAACQSAGPCWPAPSCSAACTCQISSSPGIPSPPWSSWAWHPRGCACARARCGRRSRCTPPTTSSRQSRGSRYCRLILEGMPLPRKLVASSFNRLKGDTVKRSSADGSANRPPIAIDTRVFLAVPLLAFAFSAYAQVMEPNRASVYPDNQTYIQPQEKTPVEKVVHVDEWKDANNPRRMLARIQSNLDRVSAGRPVSPAPAREAFDPLLKIVDAYSDFLSGDFKSMDAHLAVVERSARTVREGKNYYGDPIASTQPNAIVSSAIYTSAIHNPSPLARLYAGIRAVNGALHVAGPMYMHTAYVSPIDGTWLKLPCRTIIGRVQQFAAVAATLKSLGGPVLGCPVDESADYANDEALALHPGRLSSRVTPSQAVNKETETVDTAEPPPGSREAALDEMAKHPQQAAPILEHYSHADALGELDYALFLHAFKPETSARDAMIRGLLSDIVKKAEASQRGVNDFVPKPYDGTDASLLNTIRLASITGVANSDSAFYAIPCAILVARPALVAATGEYFGSNMDNFMPRSGCAWGRGGAISGFPDEPVDDFESASTEADGNFIQTFQGSMVYGFESAQNAINTKMQLDPRSFLDLQPEKSGDPSQAFQYPYQVWGYTGLNNYVVSLRIRKLYIVA